jgi:hypothetical protein
MKRARMLVGGVLFASLALLAGCEDDLPKATEIKRMRILGAQLSVVGDETRSTPRPGEDVRVSFATVFPDLDDTTDEMQTLLIGCTAPDRFTGGIPFCQEFLDAAQNVDDAQALDAGAALGMAQKVMCSDIPGRRQTFRGVTIACVDGDPAVELPIDASFEAPQAMFLGITCQKGRAFIDPESATLFGCDDNEDGESIGLHGTYTVQHEDDDENRNPTAGDLELITDEPQAGELDVNWLPRSPTLGVPEPEPLVEDACRNVGEGSDTLRVLDVGRHDLSMRYPADAREEVEGEAEIVEVTIYSTSGEMQRRFTVWTDESEVRGGRLRASVEWQPDRDDRPVTGKLVRFFATVRDQRGGFDMATYAACIP